MVDVPDEQAVPTPRWWLVIVPTSAGDTATLATCPDDVTGIPALTVPADPVIEVLLADALQPWQVADGVYRRGAPVEALWEALAVIATLPHEQARYEVRNVVSTVRGWWRPDLPPRP